MRATLQIDTTGAHLCCADVFGHYLLRATLQTVSTGAYLFCVDVFGRSHTMVASPFRAQPPERDVERLHEVHP